MSVFSLLLFAIFAGIDGARMKRQGFKRDPNCMCIDYYGECRKTDTDWVDDDVWMYSCSKMGIKEVGCQTTNRARGMKVPFGQNITINGFWHACERMRSKMKYSQEHSCEIGGTLYHVGETVHDGHFVWQCFEYGIGASGCIFTDPAEGKIQLEIGETKSIGCYNHTCKVGMRNPWTIRYVARPVEECLTASSPEDEKEKKAKAVLIDEKLTKVEVADPTPPLPALIYSASFVRSDDSSDVRLRYLD